MNSPPLELVLDVAHIGARNLLRNHGTADGDTISEITRGIVERLGPAGPPLLAVALAAASTGFFVHIVAPLRREV